LTGPLIREGYAKNGTVRLHYTEIAPDTPSGLTPLVYIHGAYGSTEGFLPEMEALAPRRCISVRLRGRGQSDIPKSGYTFNDNVSDIEALVDHLRLTNFCLMGWSMGVPYSIGFASRHPEKLSGLILLDYQARYPKYSVGWAERWASDPSIMDRPDRIKALRGLEKESSEVLLWENLEGIDCPVLLIGGGRPDSLLKKEHVDKYRQHLRNLEVMIFSDSGHNVSQPDFGRFITALRAFLGRIDQTGAGNKKRSNSATV
jgi:pimeloyl-ACP methyl ester carboxylesterase